MQPQFIPQPNSAPLWRVLERSLALMARSQKLCTEAAQLRAQARLVRLDCDRVRRAEAALCRKACATRLA